jgi:hypothetical protein
MLVVTVVFLVVISFCWFLNAVSHMETQCQLQGFSLEVYCVNTASVSEEISSYFQVTYAFCKEFISLLLDNVGAGGELPTIDVLVKLFRKVCCFWFLHYDQDGYLKLLGEIKMCAAYCLKNLKGRDHLGYLDINGRILKLIVKK